MLAHGIYPERLKFSLIKPIHKSGVKSSPSNYRPIYLVPLFSKNKKKVIYKRLFDHLNNNVILNEHQYGFWSEVTTENASYKLLNEILTALNNKQMVGGIFCDPP
jgi:sarcosine oxidase/L-pipecolate oxidase